MHNSVFTTGFQPDCILRCDKHDVERMVQDVDMDNASCIFMCLRVPDKMHIAYEHFFLCFLLTWSVIKKGRRTITDAMPVLLTMMLCDAM